MKSAIISFVVALVAVVVGFAVLGGSDDAPDPATPGRFAEASVGRAPTTPASRSVTEIPADDTPVTPALQARHIVEPSYSSITDWQDRYASQWHTKPTARWTAQRITDVKWIARMVLSDDAGHRVDASWTILAPLGPHPTKAQIQAWLKHDGVLPEPRNAAARRLSRTPSTPTPSQTRGPVSLRVVLVGMQGKSELIVDPAEGFGPDDPAESQTDAVLRGRKLSGLKQAGLSKVRIGPNTLVRARSKAASTASSADELGAASSAGGAMVVEITWTVSGRQPDSLKQLLKEPATAVEWTKP